MDWAVLIAGVITALGSLFAYLNNRHNAQQLTNTIDKLATENDNLKHVNERKTEYIRQVNQELVKHLGPADRVKLLNSLFPSPKGGSTEALPPDSPEGS